MQIRSVTAHAFGPLHGETLELAEGMTVVVGGNESAKSSWHTAIYSALCGRRRGRGRSRLDEQRFADLHRPWDGSEWLVSAQLVLDNGRLIEMRQDLAGKVDCHAKDLALGQDISADVMNDGTPDGSRWLGLDRDSFIASACVEQAQLLRVLDDAEGLQEHLQRAAATAGTDATAAAALDCIDEFVRENVGTERVNSTKPLQRAIVGYAHAQEELERCRRAHGEYLTRVETVDQLRKQAAVKSGAVRAHEAAAATADAKQLTALARRAAELHAIYGDTAPDSVADDDALARQVSATLAEWQSRPDESELPERPSSAQIRAELDALPSIPGGDVEPHPSVLTALDEVKRAETQLDQHTRSRPPTEVHVPPVAAGDDELLDMARALEAPLPTLRGEPKRHTAAGGTSTRSAIVLIGIGAALAIAGGVLIAVSSPIVGAIVFVAGLAVVGAGVLRLRGTADSRQAVAREKVAAQVQAHVVWRRDEAFARCVALGITPDPTTVRAIPVARAQAAGLASHLAQWSQQDVELRARAGAACAELAGALAARGYAPRADRDVVLATASQYQQECRRRAVQAVAAARRADLTVQLSAVHAAEQRAVQDEQQRARTVDLLLAAAQACGVPSGTPEQAAGALQEWVREREARLGEVSHTEREWAELVALLAGRPLADLEQSASSARDKANRLNAAVDQAALAAVDPVMAAERLPTLRQTASAVETQAAEAEGELRLFALSIGSVAEAEEALERAQGELDRVRDLQETLRLTHTFLSEAQTRVHRDIAPVLAANVKRSLPALTDDRYTDVIVDPTTLQVQVCGPSRLWRDAGRLSYGTAEQVYLLLRVALADHLTKGHDTCPLLLDDVTVHADATRTRKILALLLEIAADRQIVVFTQEEQVAAWARENSHGPRNAIRELHPVLAA